MKHDYALDEVLPSFSAAQLQVVGLVCGYPKALRDKRLIVPLQAVIDDSGRGQGQMFVFAGFVLSFEEWMPFVSAWQAVLDEHPRIEYFKMKEAHRRDKQFASFSVPQRDKKIQGLLSVILNHRPTRLQSAIPYAAYEEAFKGKIAKGTDYPYFLGYYEVIGVWLRYHYCYGPKHQKVDFVFDDQQKEGDIAVSAWRVAADALPEHSKPLIGGKPIQRDEKTFVPLQAADLLAWHVRRDYAERFAGREFDDPVWGALQTLPCANGEMTRERLMKIVEGVQGSGCLFEYNVPTAAMRKMLKRQLAQKRAAERKE